MGGGGREGRSSVDPKESQRLLEVPATRVHIYVPFEWSSDNMLHNMNPIRGENVNAVCSSGQSYLASSGFKRRHKQATALEGRFDRSVVKRQLHTRLHFVRSSTCRQLFLPLATPFPGKEGRNQRKRETRNGKMRRHRWRDGLCSCGKGWIFFFRCGLAHWRFWMGFFFFTPLYRKLDRGEQGEKKSTAHPSFTAC